MQEANKRPFLLHLFSGIHFACPTGGNPRHAVQLVVTLDPRFGSDAGAVCDASAAFIDTRESKVSLKSNKLVMRRQPREMSKIVGYQSCSI